MPQRIAPAARVLALTWYVAVLIVGTVALTLEDQIPGGILAGGLVS